MSRMHRTELSQQLIDIDAYIKIIKNMHQGKSNSIDAKRKMFVNALKQRANLYNFTGQYDKGIADIKRAINISKVRGLHSREVLILTIDLADAYARGKNAYEYALKLIKKNLKIVKNLKEINLYAKYLEILGIINFYQGKYAESLKNFHQALIIYRKLRLKRNIALINGNIGLVYREQGDLKRALKYYKEYMATSKSIGYKKGLTNAYSMIGVVYRLKGKLDKALKFQNSCLILSKEIGDVEVLNNALNNIGNIYYNKGDLSAALECYAECVKLSEKLQDQRGGGLAYSNMGAVYYDKGDFDNALKCMMKLYKFARAIGFKRGIVVGCNQIASVLIEQCEFVMAKKYLKNAEKIYKQIGNEIYLVEIYLNLTQMNIKKDCVENAIKYAKKALKLARKINAIEQEITALRLLSKASYLIINKNINTITESKYKKGVDEAIMYLKKSVMLARKQHLPFELAMSLYELALACQHNDYENSSVVRKKVNKYLVEARKIFLKADTRIWIERTRKALSASS